jgi:hypothetical protein
MTYRISNLVALLDFRENRLMTTRPAGEEGAEKADRVWLAIFVPPIVGDFMGAVHQMLTFSSF